MAQASRPACGPRWRRNQPRARRLLPCPRNADRLEAARSSRDAGFFRVRRCRWATAGQAVEPVHRCALPIPSRSSARRAGRCVSLCRSISPRSSPTCRQERYAAEPQRIGRTADIDCGGARASITRCGPSCRSRLRKHLQRIRLRGWDRIPFPQVAGRRHRRQLMEVGLRPSVEERRHAIAFRSSGSGPTARTAALVMTHDVESAAGADVL